MNSNVESGILHTAANNMYTINCNLGYFQQRAVTIHQLAKCNPLSHCPIALNIHEILHSVVFWQVLIKTRIREKVIVGFLCFITPLQIISKCHSWCIIWGCSPFTSESKVLSRCSCLFTYQGQFRWIDCPLWWHCLNIKSIKDITINKGISTGVMSSLLAQALPLGSKNSRHPGEWERPAEREHGRLKMME